MDGKSGGLSQGERTEGAEVKNKRTPGLIIEPRIADEETHKRWFRTGLRKPNCDICKVEIKVGDTFAATYTNYGDNVGGNPITCSTCLEIPFEQRIAWWNAQHDERLIAEVVKALFVTSSKDAP